ncbi:transcription elongation factor GreA [Acidaminobacter hydrogenoformans]|uniref:Transcription elongation factor GreA n=1 Tax=Acidaminobacter hydrogenoformans DSM 2784 TaxID=1120920 RepID=A0A1G5RQ42_9FIRM|nr:transcription elongation factor GreA [Acidaminobacter hydrogenoformans]SCZ75970.1 transcription elongation factor GreA [Acidaminobacter hydrogenoformans DSM 2784]
MMSKEVLMTPDGLKKIEEELDHLKSVRRREIAEKIKAALAFGDISENAEYDEAKNEQAELEKRIMKLEGIVGNAVLIDESEIKKDEVSVGSTVTVKDIEFDEVMEYAIVGPTEADPYENKISNESPVGKALIGKRVGETIEVQVPDGFAKFQIVKIGR